MHADSLNHDEERVRALFAPLDDDAPASDPDLRRRLHEQSPAAFVETSGTRQSGAARSAKERTIMMVAWRTAAAGSFPLEIQRQSTLDEVHETLDLSATISPDGRTLRVFAVNMTDQPRPTRWSLAALGRAKSASAVVLKDNVAAQTSQEKNTPDDPTRISPTQKTLEVEGDRFACTFEPFSVTRLDVAMQVIEA